jgi:ElaB/YqjD/DUF883 family membrane-anchored ribosome-binding protein
MMQLHLSNEDSHRVTERVRYGAHGAIDGVSGRMKPAVDQVARRAHALVDKVGFAASDAAEAVVRSTRAVTHAPARALTRCRDGVRAYPLVALGIAALVGAALVAFWKARSRV